MKNSNKVNLEEIDILKENKEKIKKKIKYFKKNIDTLEKKEIFQLLKDCFSEFK